jgi:solute:Na+ symporter, SSS family
VVAGLLAAAMSSLSAGYSSCCAVISSDFVDRFCRSALSGHDSLRLTRSISVAVGALTTLLSLVMVRVPGNILEMTNKTVNLFVAPLFSLFFMAIFVPFATKFGTFQGALYGAAAGVLVGYWDVLTGKPGLSWTWLNPASLVVAVIAGCVFSLLPTRGRRWPVLAFWTAVAATPLACAFYAATTM